MAFWVCLLITGVRRLYELLFKGRYINPYFDWLTDISQARVHDILTATAVDTRHWILLVVILLSKATPA